MNLNETRKVLLLGGTGAMGVYLVPELLRLGYRIFVTSRNKRVSNEKNLHYLEGDAKDKGFLDKVLQSNEYDVIVDFMVYHTDEFRDRIELLLEKTEHYIFLSSYRVFADNGNRPLSEESPRLLDTIDDKTYLSTDEYGLAKARQEDMLQNSKQNNWTIVRPTITYSRNRFQLGTMEANEFLHRGLKSKSVIFPREMLDKRTTMSWAGDVAKMIARLAQNESAFGETYIVSTSESYKWREIADIYKEILNMKIKIVSLAEYTSVIGRPYQIEYDRMYHRIIDNRKILSTIDMKQSDLMPLKEGLRMELAGYSRTPESNDIDLRKDKKMDKLTMTRIQKIRVRGAPRTRLRQARALLRSRIKYDGAIVSLSGYYNYGGLIQRYALQTFLKKNGYDFRIFSFKYMLKLGKKVGDRKNLKKFAEEHMDEEVFDPRTAKFYKSYIVGSDQVWRDWFNDWNKFGNFFLKFVGNRKAKRIAYAASFGVDDLNKAGVTGKNKKKIISLLKKFNAISVREKSARKLVEELKGQAVTTIDPTLLLSKNDYSKLIDVPSTKDKETSQIFYYLLDPTDLKTSIIDRLESVIGVRAEGIVLNSGKRLPKMEEWLKGFRDSDIVATDSFHGIVFSVINKTPFIAFGNKKRGLARMIDFLKPLGLESRIISEDDVDKVDTRSLLEPIDWIKVDEILDNKRSESSKWLLSALKNQ